MNPWTKTINFTTRSRSHLITILLIENHRFFKEDRLKQRKKKVIIVKHLISGQHIETDKKNLKLKEKVRYTTVKLCLQKLENYQKNHRSMWTNKKYWANDSIEWPKYKKSILRKERLYSKVPSLMEKLHQLVRTIYCQHLERKEETIIIMLLPSTRWS